MYIKSTKTLKSINIKTNSKYEISIKSIHKRDKVYQTV